MQEYFVFIINNTEIHSSCKRLRRRLTSINPSWKNIYFPLGNKQLSWILEQ